MRWFTLAGLKEEVRKIEWPNRKDMVSDTTTVLVFVAFFAVFFVAAEVVIAQLLKVLGVY